jgi:TetR/AcrR family transcriptional regulator, lmrAB and yxaGH operons repressor
VNPRENVRSNMVEGAVRLLATEGVEGTSFKEVLAVAEAPRGSVYHHFPGGKSELLHAALDRVSERALGAMEATRGQSAPEVLERFLRLWRALLDYSRLGAGCAVVSVTVAGPDGEILDHVGTIFRDWTDKLAELFVAGGMSENTAHRMATVTIAATEGAVVLSRAQRSRDPFDDVASTLSGLVRNVT